MIIGFVGAFGWVLTYSKFPFTVAAAIASIAPEWWLFLLLVIALYVVLGTFLTPSEIILVTVPVLLPVASAVGVHPIHFGMVCVVAYAIGHITPPVGLCLLSVWLSAACRWRSWCVTEHEGRIDYGSQEDTRGCLSSDLVANQCEQGPQLG